MSSPWKRADTVKTVKIQSETDIDTDLGSSDLPYGSRDIVIAYIASKYGRAGICGITTPSTLAPRAAIESVAKVQGSRYFENLCAENGWEKPFSKTAKDKQKAVADEFLKLGDKIKKLVPKDPNASFDMEMKYEGEEMPLYETMLKTIDYWAEEAEISMSQAEAARKIIDVSRKLEGSSVGFGRHACGMIVVDNGDVAAYAPQMMDTRTNTLKIQMDAEQAEAKGFLKFDLLALKQCNKITQAMRDIYKNHGIFLKTENIPQEIDVYRNIFSKGLTNEVFQFESAGMKKMLQEFEPESFEDITLLVACYRPFK